jgi:MFS family permease
MTDLSQTAPGYASGAGDLANPQRGRLFTVCFISMFATSFAFIVRALVITEWGNTFNLTEAQKGAIFPGAALFPFAISIVLFSLFIDRLGYGKTMWFAWVGHIVGTVVTIFAGRSSNPYMMLYVGTFITSLANGAIEAVVNPVVATIYDKEKTHRLNMLHAGWPGGLVVAGVLAILMGTRFSWEWKVGLVLIPTVIYGIMLLGLRFPVQERVAAGVSYADMMREFGAAGAFLLAYFLTMATLTVVSVFLSPQALESSTWVSVNNWLPLAVALVCSIGFFAVYRSFGRPMFVFLLLVMILLATTELGTDGWITDLLTPIFGRNAGWILVYTSAIMFVMRFFAGPIVHRLSPLGLLAVCAAIAVLGLNFIAGAGANGLLVFLAATLYGVGKSFFWPTTLGVVAEQFPRGGALTLNAMGGMGMIAVGVLGGDVLGTLVDKRVDQRLANDRPAIHSVVAGEQTKRYGMEYRTLDRTRVAALPAEQQAQVNAVQGEVKQGTLRTVAILPAIMFVCYIGLILYFKSRGGYKAEVLTGHAAEDEKFTGGVPGPADR